MRKMLISVALLLIAAPVWAVVVAFEASDSSGQPLSGATIRIDDTPGGLTGNDGRISPDLPVEIGQRVRVVVTHKGDVVFDGEVEVPPRGPVRLPTSVPPESNDLVQPFSDGFESGDTSSWPTPGPGGHLATIGVRFDGNVVKPSLSTQTFDIVTRVDGQVVDRQSGSLSPGEIDDANSMERKRHEIPGAAGVRLDVALPPLGGAGDRALLAAAPGGVLEALGPPRALFAARPSMTAGAGGAPAPARRGWRIYPSLDLGVSQADVEFQSIDLVNRTRATFEGDGLLYAAGIQGVVVPCGDCRWFGVVGYRHMRTETVDMTRNPDLQAFLPAGILAVEDEVRYRAVSDSVRATVGRAFRHAAPWAGVRGTRFRADLDLDLLVRAVGMPAEQSQSARNEYEEDLVEAIAGVDVRIPGTALVLRIEGSSDGDSRSLAVGLGLGFGR